ncbi:MAG: isoprenylcysteine carboxylmethyltransferase family protein [Bacteroidetes bacterium]|nr:isoprenylcysteine carboxylmethyltransferase family protein [Bacteroidota bacterium]
MKSNYLLKHIIGSFIFFACIFISAGRINYWQGLIYLTIGLIMFVLNYTIFRINSQLLKERANPGDGTKNWDKILLGLLSITSLSMNIIAGLDSGRFHWSPEFHWSVILVGIIFTIIGQLLFLIAQKQNKFFSSTVRIQADREHSVCDTGLYKIVRHPAYLGMIIQSVGFPLLFGSLWSLIPICLSIIIAITRTNLEDKTLKAELKGYIQYSLKTKYRLIPFVW